MKVRDGNSLKRILWIVILVAIVAFLISIRLLPRYGPPETMAFVDQLFLL